MMCDIRRTCMPVFVALMALAVRGPIAHATPQSPASTEQRFEVASIKPALRADDFSRLTSEISLAPGGRVNASTITLETLILRAYGIRRSQLIGAPKWATSEYFDIEAIAGPAATANDVRSMLRTLLAERFSLRAHREIRSGMVQTLTIARSDGRLRSGLTPTTPACLATLDAVAKGAPKPAVPVDRPPTGPICGETFKTGARAGGLRALMAGVTIETIVQLIANELDEDVLDRTQLIGVFDVQLEYMSVRALAFNQAIGLADPKLSSTHPDAPPPLAAALEGQLGLKLTREPGQIPVVVIDGVERPTEN